MGILKNVLRPTSDATPKESHKPTNVTDKITGWKNRTPEQEAAIKKQLEENQKSDSLKNNTWSKSKGKY